MKALDTRARKAGMPTLGIFVASRPELRKIAEDADALCKKASKLAAKFEDTGDLEGRKKAVSVVRIANNARFNALEKWRAP